MGSWRYWGVLAVYVLFLAISLLTRGPGADDLVTMLLTASTFLFAIFLAFSTANRHARLSAIREALRDNDASLLTVSQLAGTFPKEKNKMMHLIDEYLIAQLDYKIKDFGRSTPRLLDLMNHTAQLKPKGAAQENVHDHLLDELRQAMTNQERISHWVNDRMRAIEWASLLILGLAILIGLFALNTGTLLAVLIIPLLGAALITFLVILWDLDSLQWQERNWIWKPLIQLFRDLGLPPYIPEPLLSGGRIPRSYLEEPYRLARYREYADIEGKKVELVTPDGPAG